LVLLKVGQDEAPKKSSVAWNILQSEAVVPQILSGGSAMGTLQFFCPATHHPASTGIETDPDSLRACWRTTVKVDCPHCGKVHEISVRETYIGMALRDAVERASMLQRPAVG
jgi:hypothetical protein